MVATSSSSTSTLGADTAEAVTAITAWQSGDSKPVVALLTRQVAASLAQPTAEASLVNTITQVFKSDIPVEQVVEAFAATVDSFPADTKDDSVSTFSLALLDVVDAVKQIKEDTDDLSKDEGTPTFSEDKVIDIVKGLMTRLSIDPQAVNLILSPSLLVPLGLHPMPRQQEVFRRTIIKLSTSIFYKQQTSNLLRESSEGFSRLIVLLTSTEVLRPQPELETDEQRRARAQNVWSQITLIVAHFGLAPPRVIDLILEIACCNLASHWRFFLELLEKSQWGPPGASASLKPGSTTPLDSTESQLEAIRHSLDVNPTTQDRRAIAEVLSFRFGFYQRPEVKEDTPDTLSLLTAILIKHGFVEFVNIFPKLSPNDDEMDALHQKYLKASRDKGGAPSRLANTVLGETEVQEIKEEAPAELQKPPQEQRINLLQALLSIGETEASLLLLSKYPWTVSAYPKMASTLLRNINYSVDGLFRETIPRPSYTSVPPLERSVVQTIQSPEPPATVRTEFVFFQPDWSAGLEIWTTIEEILTKGQRWLSLLAGLGGRSSDVMSKICRIVAAHFTALRKAKVALIEPGTPFDASLTEPTASEMKPWLDLLRNTLLPALTVADPASGSFAHEVWNILAFLPMTVRYGLYGEWRDSTCNSLARTSMAPAANATMKAVTSIKQTLGRVTSSSSQTAPGVPASQATEKQAPRALAKLGFSNPTSLWTTINQQVMSYGAEGNIGEFVVEVGRYINFLAKDVAVFTWVDQLSSGADRRRLENLATFIGLVNRRYSFDLKPLLQYIANRLRHLDPAALVVLEKLMSGMMGEAIVENYAISPEQLQAYASGPEMQREAFYQTEIVIWPQIRKALRSRELLKDVKKSLPLLVGSLRDTKLAVPILVGLALLADSILGSDWDTPLKAKGLQSDSAQDVFTQYIDLLARSFSREEILNLLPDFATLQNDYQLDLQLIWKILRPKLKIAVEAAEDGNAMAVDNDDSESHWWPSALQETIDEAAAGLTPIVRACTGTPFYVRYNSLAASDIGVFTASYNEAHARLTKFIGELERSKEKGSDVRNEIARLRARRDQLQSELKSQEAHVKAVRERLQTESAKWFDRAGERQGLLVSQLLEVCFYPRAVQSPADALFVAKFIRLAHSLGTPNFPTVLIYNGFFAAQLGPKIAECTESEARNLGRTLSLILADLNPWHQSEAVYQKEALGVPPTKKGSNDSAVDSEPKEPLPGIFFRRKPTEPKAPMAWATFRTLYSKCHNNLCQALVANWEKGSSRNATIVALAVLKQFPIMTNNADQMRKAVKALIDSKDTKAENRPPFTSYLNQLEARGKKQLFVSPRDFGAIMPKAPAKPAATEPATAAPAVTTPPTEATAPATGATTAPAEPPAVAPAATTAPTSSSDAKALRAKLEQNRNTRAAANAAKEAKTAPTSPAHQPSRPEKPTQPDTPAGLPKKPETAPARMGPPPELSVDEARAQARLRKFGAMTESAAPPSGPRREGSRSSTPRRSPPPPSARGARSGTDDSRVSDRARRPEDDRDRDRRRDDRPDDRRRDDRRPDDRDRDGRRDEPRNGRDERRDDRRDERRDDHRDGRDARDGRNGRGGERRDEPRDDRRRDDRRDDRRRDEPPRNEPPRDDRSRRDERAKDDRGRDDRWPNDRAARETRSRDQTPKRVEGRDSPAARRPDGKDTPPTSKAEAPRETPREAAREAPREDDRRRRGDRPPQNGPRDGDRPPADRPQGDRTPVEPRDRQDRQPADEPRDRRGAPAEPRDRRERGGADRRDRQASGDQRRNDGREARDSRDRRDNGGDRTPRERRGEEPRGEKRDERGQERPRQQQQQPASDVNARGPAPERQQERPRQQPAQSEQRQSTSGTPGASAPRGQAQPAAPQSLAARMGLTTTPSTSPGPPDNSNSRDQKKRALEDGPSSREDSPGVKRSRRSGGRRSEGGGGSAGGRLLAGAMRAASGSNQQ